MLPNKKLLVFIASLFLTGPINSYADVKVIIGTPYYGHSYYGNPRNVGAYYGQRNYKRPHYSRHNYRYKKHYSPAKNYAKRHNYGSQFNPYNPHLNHNYSYNGLRNKHNNGLYPRKGYGRNTYSGNAYKHNNKSYKKGYRQGFKDGSRHNY
jgi:hypothetical protein